MNPWVVRPLFVAGAVASFVAAGGDVSVESLLKVAAGALLGALAPQAGKSNA